MYEISVEDTFDAAHCLPDYDGSCRRLHGHTYRVRARFRYGSLAQSGMALDFRQAKDAVKGTLEYMDHQYINDLPEFSIQPPTAENIARFIYDRLAGLVSQVWSVTVWETPTSSATYFPDGRGASTAAMEGD